MYTGILHGGRIRTFRTILGLIFMVHRHRVYTLYRIQLYYIIYIVICCLLSVHDLRYKLRFPNFLDSIVCTFKWSLYIYVWNTQYCIIFVLTRSIVELVVFITNEWQLHKGDTYLILITHRYTVPYHWIWIIKNVSKMYS